MKISNENRLYRLCSEYIDNSNRIECMSDFIYRNSSELEDYEVFGIENNIADYEFMNKDIYTDIRKSVEIERHDLLDYCHYYVANWERWERINNDVKEKEVSNTTTKSGKVKV